MAVGGPLTAGTLLVLVGGAIARFVHQNHKRSVENDTAVEQLDDRLQDVETDIQQVSRLQTASAYTLDQVLRKLNHADSVDVEFEELHFRDDFLRGGDSETTPDGGQIAPAPDEAIEDYHERLFACGRDDDD